MRAKILLPFVALFALEALAGALLVGRSQQQNTYRQSQESLSSLASLTSQSLRSSAQALAQQASLICSKADMGTDVVERDVPDLIAALAQVWWAEPPFLVEVVDEDGRALVHLLPGSTAQRAPRDLGQVSAALAAGQRIAVVRNDTGSAAYLMGAAPILAGGAEVGRLVILTRIDDTALAGLRPDHHYDLAVAAADRVVASTGQTADGTPWTMPSAADGGGVAVIGGSKQLVEAVPLPVESSDAGLWLVASTAYSPVHEAASGMWVRTLTMFGVGIVAAALIAAWVAARISRPLRQLTTATARLSAGDLDARASVSSHDEIGKLARSFNHMGAELKDRARRLDVAFEELRHLSETDPLTGLLNRRTLQRHLQEETERALLDGGTLAVVMLDIDDFKFFNDTYGHLAGDQVIVQVAQVLKRMCRWGEWTGRYGGDEFMLVLRDSTVAEAERAAERLRVAQAREPFRAPDGQLIPVRLSAGVAGMPASARDAGELVACADANLYESKRRGGDTVTCREDWQPTVQAGETSFGMLESLVTAVDNKDCYTRRHSEDVTVLALAISAHLDLPLAQHDALRVAGLLHDVGKIGVPDRILRKPGGLTGEEHEVMKQHALLGESIINGIPDVETIRSAVVSHHERFDGSGYPRGLAGEEIPLLGRILAVADAYSAMIADRPYRKALSAADAIMEIRLGAGTQFDPRIVDAFLSNRQALRVHRLNDAALDGGRRA
jgi:diguanylate cyclase (GGDEF)-like protein